MTIPEVLSNEVADVAARQSQAFRAVLYGTLLAGALDICAAMLSVQLRGIPAIQAVKGVAAGWLGKDAFRGGAGVVALGFVSHFAIMSVIALVFYALSRAAPAAARQWPLSGAVYGMLVYAVMSLIVVPLSAFPRGAPPSIAVLVQNVLIHIVCVGLPIAFVAHRFSDSRF